MRFYYRPGHPRADELGFVNADDLAEIPMEPPQALHAPVMSGRFYENTQATDGSDIGSRSKHREYMKRNGLTTADDFSPRYFEQVKKDREESSRKSRRETIERRLYEIDKP